MCEDHQLIGDHKAIRQVNALINATPHVLGLSRRMEDFQSTPKLIDLNNLNFAKAFGPSTIAVIGTA
jgi:hypothetical protein